MLQHDARPDPHELDGGAELRALRRRAYGPDADIADDPAAVRRLRELETRQAQRAASPPAGPDDGLVEQDRHPGSGDADPRAGESEVLPSGEPPQDAAPDTASGSAPQTAGRPRRLSRRLLLVWVASLVVAVLVAATVSWALTRRVQADPQQVAVLGMHPDQRLPTVFGTDPEGRRFADFYGLTVIALEGRGWMGGGTDDYCLILMNSGRIELDTNSYSGEMYGGCGAGTFPATVQLRVSEELPDALRDRFGDDTALQFVLGDGEVAVLSDQG